LSICASFFFTNSVGNDGGYSFEYKGWAAFFVSGLYFFGFTWAVFVVVHSIRKLSPQLLGAGEQRSAKAAVFLVEMVIMFYAPYLLPALFNQFSYCGRSVLFGSFLLTYDAAVFSVPLCNYLVWRRYASQSPQPHQGMGEDKFTAALQLAKMACWLLVWLLAIAVVLLGSMLTVSSASHPFSCYQPYTSWLCFSSCPPAKGSNATLPLCGITSQPVLPEAGGGGSCARSGQLGIDVGLYSHVWSVTAHSFSAVASMLLLLCLLRAPSLREMYHFQLVLLLACCEALGSLLFISLPPSYLRVGTAQFFQLASFGFLASLLTFILVSVWKPWFHNRYMKRRPALRLNACVVFMASGSIAAGLYLSNNSNASGGQNVLLLSGGTWGVASMVVLLLFGVWSIFVVAYVMYIVNGGQRVASEERVSQARASVLSLVTLVAIYSVPGVLDMLVVRPLSCDASLYWRACAQVLAGGVVQTGSVACLVVWRRQLLDPSSAAATKERLLNGSSGTSLRSTADSTTSIFLTDESTSTSGSATSSGRSSSISTNARSSSSTVKSTMGYVHM
jgi:hypothetical protein